MRWRRRLITLHRDVGYLSAGLVLVYAVSGVAVNHRHHWNYNQSVEQQTKTLPNAAALLGRDDRCAPDDCLALARRQPNELVAKICGRLGRDGAPQKVFWRGPRRLTLFFTEPKRLLVDYNPVNGRTDLEIRTDRPLIRQVNFLHLNESRRVWTWIADAFAVALVFLALSGLFLVKGKRGLRGRGGVLFLLGLAIPAVALWFLW